MDEFPALKLIQPVDPRKIKVAINEKFSKLTLSSNKKDKEVQNHKVIDHTVEEKRRSASRNIMDELNGTNKKNEENNAIKLNVLLKSNSWDDIENTASLTEISQKNNEFEASQSMECLQMSVELTEQQMEEPNNIEIETLTQKVSNMSVSKAAATNSQHRDVLRKDTEQSIATIDISSESDDEESVIYVSDTSDDENIEKIDKPDYMFTSDLTQDGGSAGKAVPLTSSNDRADRMEAFLRDVSFERRNIEATGGYPDDSIMPHLNPQCKRNENNESLFDQSKAKLIAIADTESMTVGSEDGERRSTSQKARNFALDDTEAMSESCLPQNSQSLRNNQERLPSQNNDRDNAARRLANDETEVNTTLGTVLGNSEPNSEIVEDSVLISDTSSEVIEDSPKATNSSYRRSKELILSEEAMSTPHSQISDHISQRDLGSVNISARINIKVQIQANFSSSEDEINQGDSQEVDEENDGNMSAKEYKENQKQNDISEDDCSESEGTTPNKNQSHDIINLQNESETLQSGSHFMTQAEKLLTELYGNAWQTPDVVRSLKRTSKSIDKTNSTLDLKGKLNDSETSKQKDCNLSVTQKAVERSLLDDFSTFQHNIVETNLDSTRLITPISKISKLHQCGKAESRNRLEFNSLRKENSGEIFKRPQTEVKTKKRNVSKRSRNAGRWRQLIDSDSDDGGDVNKENITDDENIDETVMTDDEENRSNASDSSWRELISEDEDEDEPQKITKKKVKTRKQKTLNNSRKNRLIYMDLSKDEVTILGDTPQHSPPANNDEKFRNHLSKLLDSCQYEERPRLEATPKSTGKGKRKLFTVNYGNEDIDDSIVAICRGTTPKKKSETLADKIYSENVQFTGVAIPPSFNIFNKRVEAVKTGQPVFKMTPTPSKEVRKEIEKKQTPRKDIQNIVDTATPVDKSKLNEICSTPNFKYGFLKSLDVRVGKSLCHPDALVFRNNYRQKKEDLTKILYELYNSKIFNDKLDVPITWNKKLQNTAGRCLNKKKFGKRLSTIELSDKVLTSADRLRCTLVHELCHAATWIFDEEGGHGAKWKEWARKANSVFPDLPKIGVCHQYDIEYKYTYKCTLCAAKSHYHSKSKKVENIRCSYCYGAIEIFLNKKDKDGNVIPTPVKEPTGFAKFVKEKYQQFKKPDMKHADVMKLLSNEFAALKVTGNAP